LSSPNIEILASDESALGVWFYTESSLSSDALRGVFSEVRIEPLDGDASLPDAFGRLLGEAIAGEVSGRRAGSEPPTYM